MVSPEEHKLYIGLGSNLDQPLRHIQQAIGELQAHPNFRPSGVSRLYRSKAVGPGEQDDYINAVVCVYTRLKPEACLAILQAIELAHGRQRLVRWGSRTLDLDMLLYDDATITSAQLSIPHPAIAERNFVIRPLLDIDNQLQLPDGRQLRDLLHIIGEQNLHVLEGF